MKQAMRRVFVGWSVVALAVMMLFSLNGWSASSGGEFAMLMYTASLPSSILAGALLNMVDPKFPVAPAFIHLLLVWVPFYFCGLVQWLLVAVMVAVCKSKKTGIDS